MQKKIHEQFVDKIELVGIVAGSLICRENKYLLVQEKRERIKGLWNLPAGYVDKGETIEQAAIREAKEESGYGIRIVRRLGVYHESVGENVKHSFLAEIVDGELHFDSKELMDAAWFSIEEVKQLEKDNKLRHPWITDSIERSQKL